MSDHAEWLRSELPALLREGVIDEAIAARLRERYPVVASTARPISRALVICALLGAALIGLGLILIIAHDWDRWSKPARLAVAFGPLLGLQALGAWVLRARAASQAWREGIALALALTAAAALALVGQIYHYPGDLPSYLLAVGLMALPLVYVFDSAAASACFLIGITVWQPFMIQTTPWMPLRYLALLALIAPFGWPLLLRGGASWRAGLFGSVLALCLAATVFIGGFRVDEHWILLRLALLVAILVLAGRDDASNGRVPLLRLGRFGGILLVLAASWRELWRDRYADFAGAAAEPALRGWLPIETLAWVALLILAWRAPARVAAERVWLAALPVAVWLGMQLAAGPGRDAAALLFDGYALVLGVLIVRRGLAEERLAVMNQGLAILAVLILMRFFDSELPFLVRGLAFIAVGASFLGANLWLRRRRPS